MKDMYFVYILECSDKSYYTGYTIDLDKRLKKHNSKQGAKYTKSRLPVKYVFTQAFFNKHDAMSYEKKIKGLNRKEKEKIVYKNLDLKDFFTDYNRKSK